jgi:DNA-binding CsgD family transcriptional regulator
MMVNTGALDAVLRQLEISGLQVVVVAVVNLPPEPTPWDRLSARERAVARLAGQALTNGQIARRLGITTHTVNFHLRQIFRKLEIGSRVSLAAHIPE